MSATKPLRCAIYTRKSSDEGLDQAFNSLDAQREAGEAYVQSQASEGWRVLKTRYDDGGYSGGSMERPALHRLLADVDAGLIDVVVVYKIDRLTRSLVDFARIVERFDARAVSFVSVTQAFNTTSSMGRLTLNVLLSFAQFEREVTGERIRDKIAASKAKGMWMGGVTPLGYDAPAPGNRTLRVNPEEAVIVRHIFARYLELGSVHRLESDLTAGRIVSKRRTSGSGRTSGGTAFSRGALFHLLANQVYIGRIVHKDAVHEGAHDGIVDPGIFALVQQHLAGNARRRVDHSERRVVKAPLTGRIFDAAGKAMSPAFSYGRAGRIYRYYVSASIQQGNANADDGIVRRVPAPAIEALVNAAVARLLATSDPKPSSLLAVRLRRSGLALTLPMGIVGQLRDRLGPGEEVVPGADSNTCDVLLPITLPLRGGKRSIATGRSQLPPPDPVLISALRKAHIMVGRDTASQPLVFAAPVSPYDRRLLRLAFLAPDIQRAILAGSQPAHCNLEWLMRAEIPLAWPAQRAMLGWRG